MAFHRARLAVLAATPGVDLIAFETIPCLLEVRAIATLLAAEYHALRAWISVTCRDGETLSSGEPLAEAVRAAERVAPAQVVAFGVNCVHPAVVEGAIRTILAVERPAVAAAGGGDALVAGPARPRRKVVVYPNRGEVFDAATHCWVERPGPDPHSGMTPSERQFLDLAAAWARAGAWGIGGCCRTTPRLIAALRKQLKDEDGDGSAV
jgi:homocysteine S-methyltransferase